MIDHISAPLVKRAIEEAGPQTNLPSWAWIVFAADLIIFFPVLLWLSYTLEQVFPVLAIVEDPTPPPAYQPVPLNDDAEGNAGAQDPSVNKNPDDPVSDVPVTSSLRRTTRLLKANGGFAALFRGFFCFLAQHLAIFLLYNIFGAFAPRPFTSVAALLATLAMVQLSTAWVHIVITPKNPLHFWRRLPPFGKTFTATFKPVVLFFVAGELAKRTPLLIGALCGVPMPDVDGGAFVPPPEWKDDPTKASLASLIMLSGVVMWVLVGLPAQVILIRIQASLLPPDENTIIPFDRSFRGRVEPAVVGGRGYATIKDAWTTFGGWRRLIWLYVKIFAVEILVMACIFVILTPEMILIMRNTTKPGK